MTHHVRPPCSVMPSETQRIVTLADHEAMSRAATEILARAIQGKPDSLLCAAAGSTPSRAYELLIEHQNSFPKLFEKLRIVQLDEWFGLSENHPALCSSQVRRQLLAPLKISDDRFIGFASNAPDAEAECRRFAAALALAGPIDLCVLGLGVNGHIAFNEPGPWLEPQVHVAKLSESSLKHPMVQQTGAKPKSGLTIGMSDILASRCVLLLVSGSAKRQAFERFMQRRIRTDFPASLLWLHPNLTVLCDEAAAISTMEH